MRPTTQGFGLLGLSVVAYSLSTINSSSLSSLQEAGQIIATPVSTESWPTDSVLGSIQENDSEKEGKPGSEGLPIVRAWTGQRQELARNLTRQSKEGLKTWFQKEIEGVNAEKARLYSRLDEICNRLWIVDEMLLVGYADLDRSGYPMTIHVPPSLNVKSKEDEKKYLDYHRDIIRKNFERDHPTLEDDSKKRISRLDKGLVFMNKVIAGEDEFRLHSQKDYCCKTRNTGIWPKKREVQPRFVGRHSKPLPRPEHPLIPKPPGQFFAERIPKTDDWYFGYYEIAEVGYKMRYMSTADLD